MSERGHWFENFQRQAAARSRQISRDLLEIGQKVDSGFRLSDTKALKRFVQIFEPVSFTSLVEFDQSDPEGASGHEMLYVQDPLYAAEYDFCKILEETLGIFESEGHRFTKIKPPTSTGQMYLERRVDEETKIYNQINTMRIGGYISMNIENHIIKSLGWLIPPNTRRERAEYVLEYTKAMGIFRQVFLDLIEEG